jgi:biopolymer transport protein TolQ
MNPQIVKTGVFDLILAAGPMGQLILVVLIGMSLACWSIVFAKLKFLKRAQKDDEKFLAFFWQSKSMEEIILKMDQFDVSPIANVFRSGIKELRKLSGPNNETLKEIELENITRALSRASTHEVAELEKWVPWLATTASSAPFIGLFGTVWGIMNSFQEIGAKGSASLAVVAPGISEALIATAFGIGAAIPAAISYNYFLNRIRRASIEMDGFSQDFLNIVQRSALQAKRASQGGA